jgi:hypothetical protein
MAVDPYIARGITPLGQGLPELALQMRGQQQRYELGKQDLANDTRRLGIYEQQVGLQGQQFQQEQATQKAKQDAMSLLSRLEAGDPSALDEGIQAFSQFPGFAALAQKDKAMAADALRRQLQGFIGGDVQKLAADKEIEGYRHKNRLEVEGAKAGYDAQNDARENQFRLGQIGYSGQIGAQQAETQHGYKLDEIKAGAQATAGAKLTTQQSANATAFNVYKTGMAGVLKALGETETGPFAGRSPALTAKQQIADGAVAAMAPVLKQLFRSAAEGTFTDKDQDLLLKMLPTRKDAPEAIAAKAANIDAIVQAKLGGQMDAVPAPSSGSGEVNWDDL